VSSAQVDQGRHRLDLPLRGGDDLEVLTARLWAAGAVGVWERADSLVAWFDTRPPVVDGDRWLVDARWSREEDRDWQAEWKASIGPVRAGRTVVVPSWLADEHEPGADELTLVLDPGRAFGSGHHATTVLCLEALDALDLDQGLAGRSVADVGCGSGILAIAAAARGAGTQAVDIDPAAAEVTAENARRNGAHLDIRVGGVEVVEGPVEVVVANLLTDVVADLAAALVGAATGWVILSGITEERAEVALTPLRDAGLRIDEVRARDGWIVVVGRPPDAITPPVGTRPTS
jgi:ribosomal protein L11 methyltransferase